MLKVFSQILVLCALLTVVTIVGLLFYSKSSHLIGLPQAAFLGNGSESVSTIFRKHLDKLLEEKIKLLNAEKQTSQDAINRTLDPCPNNSPDLVGPFSVEFNHKRTWNEVRKKISAPLHDGGRYKPTNCVSKQKVAIIVPYRNRHEHLKHLLFYLHPMLIRQQLDYGIYIVNQHGEGVFNRAKLMNVGFAEALKDYDYDCFVFSDVDLVPMDDRNLYRCFETPRHLSVAIDKFNFRLPYATIFGGVCSFSKDQFITVNGYPNTYWGWGGEDDDMYKRIVFHGMAINRPDTMKGKYKMIKHERDEHNEVNPKNPDKLTETHQTMEKDGLNDLSYTVIDIVKDKLYTYISVDINAPKTI